jgi:Carboxypeptidase regulatory-like domain
MMSGFAHCMRQTLSVVLFVFSSCALLAAQNNTEGAIGGTVFDKTGAVVGQASIVVHNNGTNAQFNTTTDASGYFRVNALQPGSYTVAVSRQGFSPYRAERVIVTVGSVTEVSPHLAVGAAAETVDVTTEAPQINYVSQEFASTLDQTAVANLPINGGRWSNFALLTPGVVSDSSAFGLLSFRGISTLLNNNTFDGADNNQAFFSEERGRTRIGYSTPMEAVQEFQVNTSNYSAEYGRSAGGVVNTVSKSGTNTIHASGYFRDRDNDWGAFNEFTQLNVETPSGFTSEPIKPTDWRKMAGGSIGGPLVKDKLFWFVAYDWYHHNFPAVAVTSNPGVFFAAPSAANISTLASRLGDTTAQATALYNTDLAGLNSLLGTVPREGDQNIFFPKLDWQINNANHASFSFNRMRWTSPAGIQTNTSVTRGIASFGNDYVKDTWGVAKLDTSITSNIINEIRFQYGRDLEFEFAQPPAAYELANLVNTPSFTNPQGLPPSVGITNGFTFGVPTFLNRPQFPDESRSQIADTLTWSYGKHTLKFGFDTSHIDDNSQNLFEQFGSFSYSTLTDYFSDLNAPDTCLQPVGPGKTNVHVPCYSSYAQGLGLPGVDFTSNDFSAFIADDWKILPRLSLSMGLRWEYQMMPEGSSLINPTVPQTAHIPTDMNNFGPRLGFAFDVFGDGKTVLRGGYGIYYGRVINSTIFNALTVTGAPGSQFTFSLSPSSTVTGPCTLAFPRIFTATPTCAGSKPSIDFFAPNFQSPQVQQMDLTLERDLGWGTILHISYLGSLGRELPDFVDTNLCGGPGVTVSGAAAAACKAPGTVTYNLGAGGPLAGNTYSTLFFSGARPNAAFNSMTEIFSGINSDYQALVVDVSHRMNHSVQFDASYTYSHAIDYGQNATTFTAANSLLVPNNIGLEKGNSIYDIPNRFVVDAVMESPWKQEGWLGWFANGWRLSPIIQIQNGLPYTLSVSGNAPGGTVSGINGSGGTNRIDVLGNDSFRMPYTLEPDVRLSKTLTFQEKYKLELSADFFNFINKQNVMSVNNTGYIVQTTNTINTASGAVACSTASPCLNFSPTFGTITGTNNSNFLYTPRQIQVGARISF